MRPYPLATSSWDSREEQAMLRVMRSGRFTMGPEVKAFEHQFAEFVDAKHAVMVNSGSSANLLMVAALVYSGRLRRGDMVAVPAVSWSTTYAPLIQFGMKLKIVDVDDSMCIDPEQIGDCDAVFAVNLLGNCSDFSRIKSPIMIVDNCESMGARFNGQEAGTFGLMGSYSTFFSHHISTMEGGIIVTDSPELHRLLVMLRAHGWTRDLPEYRPSFNSFEFEVPGYSVRPTELQGAIGQEQLKKLPEMLAARCENARIYQQLFPGHIREVGRSSWFGFPLVVDDRFGSLKKLDGVETRPIVAGNILRQRMMRFADMEIHPTPNADRMDTSGFFIGNHHYDLRDELCHVAERLGVLTDTIMSVYEEV